MSRVKWDLEPKELSEESSSFNKSSEQPRRPLKSSLKKPCIAVPIPDPNELLEWAKDRHFKICNEGTDWRAQGVHLRKLLVAQDEKHGGHAFELSNHCKIERYFEVGERVLEQFLATSIDESSELTESYLVGNRLLKFLSSVLPSHVDYFGKDPNIWELRSKSQKQLLQLLQYFEHLALVIDEDEYNKYILKDLKVKEAKKSKPTKPKKHLGLNEFFQKVQVSRSERDDQSTWHSGKRTATESQVRSLLRDLEIPGKDVDSNTVSTTSDSLFDFRSSPKRSLLDDSRSEITEEDPLFSPEESILFIKEDVKGLTLSETAASMHSSSWDNSFSQFAIHHGTLKDKTRVVPLTAIGKSDLSSTVDTDWEVEWVSENEFATQPNNVFRRKPVKVTPNPPKQSSSRQLNKNSQDASSASSSVPAQSKNVLKTKQLDSEQHSPKSATSFPLPQWVSWDEGSTESGQAALQFVPPNLQGYETYQQHYDTASSVHSDEENQSLTNGIITSHRSGPLRKMKGCVKCFLD